MTLAQCVSADIALVRPHFTLALMLNRRCHREMHLCPLDRTSCTCPGHAVTLPGSRPPDKICEPLQTEVDTICSAQIPCTCWKPIYSREYARRSDRIIQPNLYHLLYNRIPRKSDQELRCLRYCGDIRDDEYISKSCTIFSALQFLVDHHRYDGCPEHVVPRHRNSPCVHHRCCSWDRSSGS